MVVLEERRGEDGGRDRERGSEEREYVELRKARDKYIQIER